MFCAVTIRQLHAGHYEAFRRAWEPADWPADVSRVMIGRHEDAPDQVLTVTVLDAGRDRAEELLDDPDRYPAEAQRLEAIAEHVESVVYRSVFEIVEELTPST
jgi:hypothetical protein